MSQTSKKLALVLVTSMLVTDISDKKVAMMPCIYYLIWF